MSWVCALAEDEIPPVEDAIPPAVTALGTPAEMRFPGGLQIADELARAGREVWLAVGAHTRMPRRYRGRDVMAWLDDAGVIAPYPAAAGAAAE